MSKIEEQSKGKKEGEKKEWRIDPLYHASTHCLVCTSLAAVRSTWVDLDEVVKRDFFIIDFERNVWDSSQTVKSNV